ncbi:MAG: hypothetical protein Pars2KO_08420 [Parasphingorhabdus sp.]
MDKAIQELLDKKAIEEVLLRYARTLDWIDVETHRTVYWPDADIDYGFFRGKAEDFVDVVIEVERGTQRRWHGGAGTQITIHSETKASAETYGLTASIADRDGEGPKGSLIGGRYLDEFEKRDGEWRISKRAYLLEWRTAFDDGCQEMLDSGFTLNMLEGADSKHPLYRKM